MLSVFNHEKLCVSACTEHCEQTCCRITLLRHFFRNQYLFCAKHLKVFRWHELCECSLRVYRSIFKSVSSICVRRNQSTCTKHCEQTCCRIMLLRHFFHKHYLFCIIYILISICYSISKRIMLIDNIFRKLCYKIDMCTTQSSGIISYDLADFKEKSNHENSGSRETLDPENGVCSVVFGKISLDPAKWSNSTGISKKKRLPNGLLKKKIVVLTHYWSTELGAPVGTKKVKM